MIYRLARRVVGQFLGEGLKRILFMGRVPRHGNNDRTSVMTIPSYL